jgi:serine phosphatase RsbU (regulator of sigma subunit)
MPAPPSVFAFIAVLLALAAFLRRGRRDGTGLNFLLGAGGACFVGLVTAERCAAALPPGSLAASALRLVAGVSALGVWGVIAALAFHEARRRDLFWIIPFGLLAAFALGSVRPLTGFALVLAVPVVARWRWLDAAGRRATAWSLAAAFAAPVLAFLPVAGERYRGEMAGFALVRCVAWARELAAVYLLMALPGLLVRWSIGMRRVSRRLALLLLLSGAVPVLLMALIWGVSTQLGVRAERALFATRLVEHTAAALRASLVIARPGAPGGSDPLAAVADAHPRWPGLRLWRAGARVRGPGAPGEDALARWPDSLQQAGVVLLEHRAWLGARAAGPPGGDVLVALVPMRQVLEADIQPALDVRLALLAPYEGDTLALEAPDPGGVARPAGAGPPRVPASRPAAPHPHDHPAAPDTSGVQLSFGNRRVVAGRGFSFTAGHGLVPCIQWSGDHWESSDAVLSADVRWSAIALGLVRTVRENPANYLPLAFIFLLALLIVMVAGADFGMVRTLGQSITAAVAALRHGAGRLEGGDLSHRIQVQGDDDLWEVAGAFNRMAAGLERAREREIERQRIEDELALARRIQARLLPSAPPLIAGLELAGTSEPAREVGGDYFDYLPLGGDRVALVVADVSGKGVGAALLMSGFRASLLSQDLGGGDLAQVVGNLNRFLHRSVEPGKFVTAFLAVLDGRTGRVRYCNAGHNAPILMGANGSVRRLETGGPILGFVPYGVYESGEEMLAPGERLVLFTDGVTEAANGEDEQWEEERLIAALRDTSAQPCAVIVQSVVEQVRAFEGPKGASDDVTLIVARRGTTSQAPSVDPRSPTT